MITNLLKIFFGLLLFASIPFLGLAIIYFWYSRALVSDNPKGTFGIVSRCGAGAGITWSLMISFASCAFMFATNYPDSEFDLQTIIFFLFLILCAASYPIALIQTYKLGMDICKKMPEKINKDYIKRELAIMIIFSAIMAGIILYSFFEDFFL